MKKGFKRAAALAAALWFVSAAVSLAAQDTDPDMPSQEEIAEMINNPLSYLWMMALQNDTFYYDGDVPGADKVTVNRLMLMPVMPFQLTEDLKVVARPWLPVYTSKLPWGDKENFLWGEHPSGLPVPAGISDTDWKSGIGDAGLWLALASNEGAKPPFVWGAGITSMFDTASKEQFGTGYNCAGPMALAFYVGEKWIYGAVAQHWWDFSGIGTPATQNGVSLSDIQVVLRYRLTPETNIGLAPNIQYNWKSEDWNVPLGLGADTLIKIGPLPVKIGAEVYYYVEHGNDDFHNDWQMRLFFVPVLPSPKWTRTPLF